MKRTDYRGMLFSLSINYDGAYVRAGFKAKKEQLHYYQAKGMSRSLSRNYRRYN